MARPGRLELPTLCLEGILADLVQVSTPLEVIRKANFVRLPSKPIQAHLSRYPLQNPLHFSGWQRRSCSRRDNSVIKPRQCIENRVLGQVNVPAAHLN